MAIAHLSSLSPEDGSALAKLLSELRSNTGSGNRGGGANPLGYGKESPFRAEEFTPTRLETQGAADLEHSQLSGLSSLAPTPDVLREAAGLSEFGSDGAGLSRSRRLAPREREAVQNFFRLGGSSSRPVDATEPDPAPPTPPRR